MNLEKAKLLSLAELKNIAEQVDAEITGIKSKEKILDVIVERCDLLSINIPEPEMKADPLGEAVVVQKELPRYIKDYPRRKVMIEARDPEVRDQPFSINEYSCLVIMGEPVDLPQPIIDMIKGLTDVRHEVKDDGTAVTREVKRFMVSYED